MNIRWLFSRKTQEEPKKRGLGSISEFFASLPETYDASWARQCLNDLERKRSGPAYMAFIFSGSEPQTWTVICYDDRAIVVPFADENQDVTIETSSDVWMSVLQGEVSVIDAERNGDIKISGEDYFLWNNRAFLFGKRPKA